MPSHGWYAKCSGISTEKSRVRKTRRLIFQQMLECRKNGQTCLTSKKPWNSTRRVIDPFLNLQQVLLNNNRRPSYSGIDTMDQGQ